jgi:predicted nucleic acid-binding protein
MKLYAESSAVLAWILGEPGGREVASLLRGADAVLSSELTLLECERALTRAVAVGDLKEAPALERIAVLRREAAQWDILRLDEEVFERARRPFPREPVRTLDALHLACALVARPVLPDLAVLTRDDRVRRNALALGLAVRP